MKLKVKMLILLSFLAAASFPAFADTVSSEQVNMLVKRGEEIREKFYNETAAARLSFLCLERFLDEEQKLLLKKNADEAIGLLESLSGQQKKSLSLIEDYPGSDWEQLYGQSRVWGNLHQAVLQSGCLLAESLFWRAVCLDDPERGKALQQVIEAVSNEKALWLGHEEILHVMALSQTGKQEDQEQLRTILHQMMVRSDLSEFSRDHMLLMQKQFELFSEGPFNRELVLLFQKKIQKKDDFPWCCQYVFLSNRQGGSEPVHTLCSAWPSSRPFVSRLLLEITMKNYLELGRQSFKDLSLQDVLLAVESAELRQADDTSRRFLEDLCKTYENPQLLCLSAEVLTNADPQAAVSFLLDAAELEQKAAPGSLQAGEIARQAAVLAYKLYNRDTVRYKDLALDTLRSYLRIAGSSADAEIQYRAASVFAAEGADQEAEGLLNLLSLGTGEYAVRAQLDLLSSYGSSVPEEKRADLENQWQTLIASIEKSSPEALYDEVITAYVNFLSAAEEPENAGKIADLLETLKPLGNERLKLLYIHSLAQSGRCRQAVSELARIKIDCQQAGFILSVLKNFVDRLEEHAASAESDVQAEALKIAQELIMCSELSHEKDHADLLWAELAARSAKADTETIGRIDKVLSRFNDSSLMEASRARAFLLLRRRQWAQAAGEWQTIRKACEPAIKTERTRSWHWWQAKYYELLCYSNMPQVSKEDLAHAVQVLNALYDEIPDCWSSKLSGLAKPV